MYYNDYYPENEEMSQSTIFAAAKFESDERGRNKKATIVVAGKSISNQQSRNKYPTINNQQLRNTIGTIVIVGK